MKLFNIGDYVSHQNDLNTERIGTLIEWGPIRSTVSWNDNGKTGGVETRDLTLIEAIYSDTLPSPARPSRARR